MLRITAEFLDCDQAEAAARAVRNSGAEVKSIKLITPYAQFNHTGIDYSTDLALGLQSPITASATANFATTTANGVMNSSNAAGILYPNILASVPSSPITAPQSTKSIVTVTCDNSFEHSVTQQLLSKGGTSLSHHKA